MRKQLFIRLPSVAVAESPQVSWVLRENHQAPGPVFRGELKDAAAQAAGARVTVLVPSADVLLAQVELPPLKGQRLMKAVPYALEEQLADDVDSLHVAVGGRDAAGRVANAVVSRQVLQSWLAQLRDAGLHPDVVSPEVFGVAWPASEDSAAWSLLVEDGQALLRTDTQMGLACELDNLLLVLRAALDSAAEHAPASLTLTSCEDSDFSTSSLYHELVALCDTQGVSLVPQQGRVVGSALLAQGFDEDSAINLLQGDFSTRGQLQKFFRPWLPVGVLLLAWVLLQAGLLATEYVRLERDQTVLGREITTLYEQTFPGSRLVPGQEKILMERGLAELRGSAGDEAGMLALLSRAGPVFTATQGLSLRALRYRNQTLDVDLVLPDLQTVDSLKQRLTQQAGLAVEIVSASARNDKVESRLSLKAAGGGA